MSFDDKPQTIELEQARVAYRVMGTGPPLLMVHGWPLSGRTFEKLVAHLGDDFTCYLPDLPGGGETLWRRGKTRFTWPEQGKTLLEFVERVVLAEHSEYFLLGQDSGAMISRELALLDGPHIKKFAMVNTEIPHHRPFPLKWIQRMARWIPLSQWIFWLCFAFGPTRRSKWLGFGGCYWDRDLIDREFYEPFVQPLLRLGSAGRKRLLGQRKFLAGWRWPRLDEMEELHGEIRMPTKLIWGVDDETFPADVAESMVGQLPACVGIDRVKKAKLWVHMERPDEVATKLRSFFGGASTPMETSAPTSPPR